MTSDLDARLTALGEMDVKSLQAEWRRLYRSSPPKRLSRQILELGVGWKLQEAVLGGHRKAVQRQLDDLAHQMAMTGEVVVTQSVDLKPGARLVREWGGRTHDVIVLEQGFQYRGRTWRSLSAIARDITGTKWSGPRFFGAGTARRV